MSVYFITAREVARVKIGCAFDPVARLERLQTASPVELKLEAILRGSHAEERQIHKLFADERHHGEWFAITDEIEAAIAANRCWGKFTRAQLVEFQPPPKPGVKYESQDVRRYAQAMAEMRAAKSEDMAA